MDIFQELSDTSHLEHNPRKEERVWIAVDS
jgi:hypothetical protein